MSSSSTGSKRDEQGIIPGIGHPVLQLSDQRLEDRFFRRCCNGLGRGCSGCWGGTAGCATTATEHFWGVGGVGWCGMQDVLWFEGGRLTGCGEMVMGREILRF